MAGAKHMLRSDDKPDGIARRTLVLGALAIALLLACAIVIVGHFTRQAAPMPEPTPAQARWIAVVETVEADAPTAAQVDDFISLARTADDADLCVFPLSEGDFMRLPAAEREALSAVLIERSTRLRLLARAVAARAAEARDAGDLDDAESLIVMLERIARANTGEPTEIVRIGHITGEAVARLGEEERAALLETRGSDAPAAPE